MQPQNQNKKIVIAVFLGMITIFLILAVTGKLGKGSLSKQSSGSASEQDQKILDYQKMQAINGLEVSASQARRPFAVVVDLNPGCLRQILFMRRWLKAVLPVFWEYSKLKM